MFYKDELTGEICLTRGDTARFSLCINQGTNLNPIQYKLKDKDNIYFAIEEPNQPFENAIVKKVINIENNLLDKDGNITFDIKSDDTVLLLPGLYYYEIKAKLYKGNEYRNGYLVVRFNDKNYTYSIWDEEINNVLSSGVYTKLGDVLSFQDTNTQVIYEATISENYITFDTNTSEPFSGLTFKQEQDEINTIIPQTKWIVER